MDRLWSIHKFEIASVFNDECTRDGAIFATDWRMATVAVTLYHSITTLMRFGNLQQRIVDVQIGRAKFKRWRDRGAIFVHCHDPLPWTPRNETVTL